MFRATDSMHMAVPLLAYAIIGCLRQACKAFGVALQAPALSSSDASCLDWLTADDCTQRDCRLCYGRSTVLPVPVPRGWLQFTAGPAGIRAAADANDQGCCRMLPGPHAH